MFKRIILTLFIILPLSFGISSCSVEEDEEDLISLNDDNGDDGSGDDGSGDDGSGDDGSGDDGSGDDGSGDDGSGDDGSGDDGSGDDGSGDDGSGDDGSGDDGSGDDTSDSPKTVPTIEVTVHENYISDTIVSPSYSLTPSQYNIVNPIFSPSNENSSDESDSDWDNLSTNYNLAVDGYNDLGEAIYGEADYTEELPLDWDSDKTYDLPGNKVLYSDDEGRIGTFANKWWASGYDEPSFSPNYGPWEIIARIDEEGNTLSVKDVVEYWDVEIPYSGGDIAWHNIVGLDYCFEAKYWTQGNEPILTGGEGQPNSWESPWQSSDLCNSDEPAISNDDTGGGKSEIETLPPMEDPDDGLPDNTPVVPPVTPVPDEEPEEEPVEPEPVEVAEETGLPEDGYEFLRTVTSAHWDYLFPLRSGRYNEEGSTRNQPPIALEDGSTDVFSLDNFKKAVLEYNAYALANGFKQFLNEGTLKQQGQEFLVFWAKSARETSGSWTDAPYPWITTYTNNLSETTSLWTGALYWVEEVGFTTNEDGTSDAIGYVDHGSSYTPVEGRSYYGRGIIQLSWNYNYGAFSAWLYDNGLMTDIITSRDTLLYRPDYVATNGALSILSGIWFWMTPQGAKPSSHDVLYGDVYNVSQTTQEQGLPQRNDGDSIPVEEGDTVDESVMAYRIGTVINIVNGGLECNKAASWHGGPPQRISYYNAYTMYFNDQINGLNATRVSEATDIWNEKVSDSSHDNIKMATCWSQKSYYGW